MKEVKAYAIAVPTNELIGDGIVPDFRMTDRFMKQLKWAKGFLGVNPDIDFQFFLFDTPEHARAAFDMFHAQGYGVKIVANPAYFDAKYLRR